MSSSSDQLPTDRPSGSPGRDVESLQRENEELKQRLKVLEQHEHLFDTLLNNLPDHIYFKDRDSQFLLVSRSMARLFGKEKPRDLVGKSDRDFFTEEHARLAMEDEARIMETGEPIVDKVEKETWPDREPTWVTTTKEPLRGAQGEVIGTYGISRDITELHRAQEENARMAFSLRERVKELTCLHKIGELVERPRIALNEILQGVVDRMPAAWLHPEATCARLVIEDLTYVTENYRETEAVQRTDILLRGQPAGFIEVGYLGEIDAEQAPFFREENLLLQDIASRIGRIVDRMRTEQALADALKKYEDLVNNLNVGVYRNTPGSSGTFLEANRTLVKIFEAESRDAFLQTQVSSLYHHPDQRQAFSKKMMEDGFVKDEELEMVTCKGRTFWASVTAVMNRDENGDVYFDGIVEDISDRKQAEEKLRLQSTALENAANSIVITDEEGYIVSVNAAFETLTGYTVDEAIGQYTNLLKSGRHPDGFYKQMWETIASGKAWHGELINRRKSGDLYTEEMTITPVCDATGHITHFIAIKQDVTVRKRVEQKMALITQELTEKNRQFEDDLHMAREIQQSLLPQTFPCFPPNLPEEKSALRFQQLYAPSGAVGGDFFDVIPVSNTRAGVFICDVMGHGMRAALVTAIMRGLMEELTPVSNHPGTFMREMNQDFMAVFQYTDREVFATALYAVFDIESGEMYYANAGHPNPVHVRKKAGIVEMLPFDAKAVGPALGLFDEATYPTNRSPLSIGDLVMLFTDGLYEVEDDRGIYYGEERLLEFIGSHAAMPKAQLFSKILEDAKQYAGPRGMDDDVCLLGVDVARLVVEGARNNEKTATGPQ